MLESRSRIKHPIYRAIYEGVDYSTSHLPILHPCYILKWLVADLCRSLNIITYEYICFYRIFNVCPRKIQCLVISLVDARRARFSRVIQVNSDLMVTVNRILCSS